ncbi:hypothetical protein [Pseudomonas sp. dw_358]|uniref:hypothetical protein n=1 Tax=Pseudomonas sp. dw_358 TaxID=2720083 RepID=UPI001BD33044|nr:hypothetical protein [Pseudomonas sp. dw_358]
MSIISKISEALTVLNTVVEFAERIKTALGVTDSSDLAHKLTEAETVIAASQAALASATASAS